MGYRIGDSSRGELCKVKQDSDIGVSKPLTFQCKSTCSRNGLHRVATQYHRPYRSFTCNP